MTKTILLAQVAEEVPWSDDSTEYDNQHDKTYIRLLDANKEGVSKDEMARLILCIDPAKEPDRAVRAVESHLAPARWMTKVGYRHLAAGRYPGGPCDPAAAQRSIGSDDHRAKD